MGTNTLNSLTAPHTPIVDDFNQYFNALVGDLVPRNATSGAPEDNVHSLGSATRRWKNAHITNLYLGGALFDPDNIGTGVDSQNAISAGATRAGSDQPDFLRAAGVGGGASATILGATTTLSFTANGTGATVETDINVTSLTTAPTTNNTCLVNDTSLAGGASTKYTGEGAGNPITIDTVGTEISNRVGEYIALKTPAGEYMLAFVQDATTLAHCYRGFFFDDSGDPITRGALSNNDTLTLMSLGWVFLENDGATVDVSYRSPIYSASAPAGPSTDDYWFDLVNRAWKRYDGSTWQTVGRILIGWVVVDGTDCVASRSADLSKSFEDRIDLEVELESTTVVRAAKGYSSISVYGQFHELYAAPFEWDITTDLESGLTEASSTDYYLYVTEDGAPKISTERPYNRMHDLKGYYHPYHSWRYVGVCYNDGSSDLTSANSKNGDQAKVEVFTSSGEFLPLPNVDNIKVTVVGGGGGGGGHSGSSGSAGGSSSFGSYCSATGGGGGVTGSGHAGSGGSGGSGSGGDASLKGQSGQAGSSGVNNGTAGTGGSSAFGGGGKGGVSSGAAANGSGGGAYGGGGGGGADESAGTFYAGGGGGGGGTAIAWLSNISGRIAVTRGAGGSGGGSGQGGSGAAGVVIVEY